MLVLTYGSPATPTQRHVFGVLHGMGLGAAERRGVAVLGDGFERFGPIAGIVCTPEGMALLATREISGADGYLFAPLRGTWTIGGRPAQIDNSGQNPVEAVDAALKTVVAVIRRGGLDPGYVQSIIAVTGAVTGIAQPETERAKGMIVTRAEGAELVDAVNVATAGREPGLPNLWTTADVTGMLEVLGFDCADLDNALLTNEGFPYSPYVLRPTSADDIPFSRPEPPTSATRALRSHADTATVRAHPPTPAVPAMSADIDQRGDHRPTGPIPALTPAVPTHEAEPEPGASGPAALLVDPAEEVEQGRSPWRWVIPLVVLALVAVAVWIGASALFGGSADSSDGTATPSGSRSASGEPQPQSVGGLAFEPQMSTAQSTCAESAYGDIKTYLAEHPCTSMTRALYLTTVEGKQVVVAIAELQMPDVGSAAALKAMADTDGTGNVNDLLREGNAPQGLPGEEVFAKGEYASSVDGSVVRIAEAAFTDGSASSPAVDAAADAALSLQLG